MSDITAKSPFPFDTFNQRLGQISSNTGNIAFWLKYPHQPDEESK